MVLFSTAIGRTAHGYDQVRLQSTTAPSFASSSLARCPRARERQRGTYAAVNPFACVYDLMLTLHTIAGKTLTAWTEFFAFWDQLGREQSVMYQTKDCQTTKLYNSTQVVLDGGNAPSGRSGIAPVKQCFELRLFELTGVVFKQCKDLLRDSVLSKLDAFGQTNTDTKQIVSYVADTTEQRLKAVLTEFASTEDNEGVLLQGDWDQTTLLCQFHAQRYVKRMISGKKYFVLPKYRKEIEALFTEMLYVPTKEQFQSRLEVFERRVKKVTPAFAKYFDRNWT
ncbi:hypothetical protein JG688_00016688, partial [Phytophthora aleatoria]